MSNTTTAHKAITPDTIFRQDNLIAWCIVPYDSQNRTPSQRIAMLKQLNFSRYAYDWRPHHLPTFAEEIRIARENDIHISAVWIWIDRDWDKIGQLSENNLKMLAIIKETGLKTQLWIGINGTYLEEGDDATKLNKSADMIRYLRDLTADYVTGIGLYNHGDWFGQPDNQIKILEALKDPAIGIVYNFHHAHEHIDIFPAMAERMRPWLWTVNLSGVKKDGPKIMPIGSGDEDLSLLQTLKKTRFSGSIGLLGHIEEEDVALVLQRNLTGLRQLETRL